MRVLLLSLVIMCALASYASPRSEAASDVAAPATAATARQAVDDNDDTRVDVQLAVLGIAIGTVFVLGTGAYLLRRKLGLVPPPPEEAAGGHH